jgi:hypothetical protein
VSIKKKFVSSFNEEYMPFFITFEAYKVPGRFVAHDGSGK